MLSFCNIVKGQAKYHGLVHQLVYKKRGIINEREDTSQFSICEQIELKGSAHTLSLSLWFHLWVSLPFLTMANMSLETQRL